MPAERGQEKRFLMRKMRIVGVAAIWASTNYSYTVSAYDAARNNSAQSSSASATTQAVSGGGGGVPDLTNYTQTYFDDFNGTTLNPSWWQVMTQAPNWGPGEVGVYLAQNTTLSNGSLLLTGNNSMWTDTTSNHTFNYQAAEVKGTGIRQKYGYFAITATMPHNTVAGGAYWPAFWFMPMGDDWSYEIDVMEQFGNNQDQNVQPYLYGHLHWNYGAGQVEICKSAVDPSGTAFSGGPHTLAVDWEPNGGFAGNTKPYIAIYYDGVLCKGAHNPTGYYTGAGVPNVLMYPIINNAIAGPGGTAVFPQSYKIDSFVAYNRNDVVQADQGIQADVIQTTQATYHPGDTVVFSGIMHAGNAAGSSLKAELRLEDFCGDNPVGGYTTPCYNAAMDNPAGGYFVFQHTPLPYIAAHGSQAFTVSMKLPSTIVPGTYQADFYNSAFPRQIVPVTVLAGGAK